MLLLHPLSLRLCCLAVMAPALTAEATSRARDKLIVTSPDTDHPHPSVPNGRGGDSPVTSPPPLENRLAEAGHKRSNPTQTTGFKPQLITLTGDLGQRLRNSLVGKTVGKNITNLTGIYKQGSSNQQTGKQGQVFTVNLGSGIRRCHPISQSTMNNVSVTGSLTASSTSSGNLTTEKMTPRTTATSEVEVPSKPAKTTTAISSSSVSLSLAAPESVATSAISESPLTLSTDVATNRHNMSNGINSLSHSRTRQTSGGQSQSQAPHTITTLNTSSSASSSSTTTTTSSVPLGDSPSPLTSATTTTTTTAATTSVPIRNIPDTMAKVKVEPVGSTELLKSSETFAKRQKKLSVRTTRILKRLRRLQTRQAISHARQQLSGFVGHQHRNLETVRSSKSQSPTTADLKAELFQTRDVKNLSTAALVNLVQKLQSSQPLTLRQHLSGVSAEGLVDQEKILRLDDENCSEFERTSGHLSSNLHHLESAVDSDATESSSGGESCDEMDYDFDWDHKTQPKPSMTQRAEWKWGVERAAVASRWTWLQAQVSDLEYRIRQQNDIYRQIRANKGAVVLEDQVPIEDLVAKCKAQQLAGKKLSPLEEKLLTLDRKNMSPSDVQQVLNNVARQSSQLAQQVGNFYSPESSGGADSEGSKTPSTPNGFVEPVGASTSHGATTTTTTTPDSSNAKRPRLDDKVADSPDSQTLLDMSCQAARCRPVRSYRKRKLLRTSGLHQISRKASRLSTVRCHCYPPIVPCAMCGGRFNNTTQLEPDMMPLQERVALLDPSFHPVLSFSQDVPLSVHFESLLKTGEWQHKQPSKHLKSLPSEKRKSKPPREGVRKYTRRINKAASAAILSSARIKNKYDSHKVLSRRPDGLLATPKKALPERARTRLCRTDSKLRKVSSSRRAEAMREMNKLLSDMEKKSSSAPGTPANDSSLSLSHSGSFSDLRRRRGPSAFDINNIVIPYSIAASTRVEKLQYKEIITPKWREVLERTANTLLKKKLKKELNASDSSTDTADSGPDFLLESGSEATLTDLVSKPKEEDVTNLKVEAKTEPAEVKEESAKPEPMDTTEVEEKPVKSESLEDGPTEPAAGSSKEGTEEEEIKAKKISEKRGSSTSSTGDPNVAQTVDETDEYEDLSEEAHRLRHTRCEIKEKKKFISYLQMQRRGRGSRTDSGTLSPVPQTPDSATLGTVMETPGSFLATPPSTPASVSKLANDNEEDSLNRSASFSSIRSEDGTVRRRTGSVSKGSRSRSASHSEERARSSFTYEEGSIPAWPRRAFPLNEYEIECLAMERPPEPPSDQPSIVQQIPGIGRPVFTLDSGIPGDSNPASPLSSEGDAMEEDPNDPEWTVVAEKNAQGSKPCLVLKLAKR